MYIMIDHYDSFVYNLIALLRELGQTIEVVRSDHATTEFLLSLHQKNQLDGIILSPGPKSPQDYGKSTRVVKEMAHKTPFLGVCLGHQIIGHTFGALVEKGKSPMHGKLSQITHSESPLLSGLPKQYEVTRYHSLVVSEKNLPRCLNVDARSDDGHIMAISHERYPLYGVQYHPEAILTQYGYELLSNFITICEKWSQNENTH